MRRPGIGVTTVLMTASSALPTGRGCVTQRAAQPRLRQIFRRSARRAGVDSYPVLDEQIQGASAHAAGDDDVDPLLLQPAGQESRLVRRRNHPRLVEDVFRTGVGFDQSELFAVAEVLGQPSGDQGNGNFHVLLSSSL